LPRTQRRRLRSTVSAQAPELALACHVERSRDISYYFGLQSDQEYLEIPRLRSE
jgi:hypothetical protein